MYVQCNAKIIYYSQIIFVTHKVDNRDVHSNIIIIIIVHLFHEPLLQFFAVGGKT